MGAEVDGKSYREATSAMLSSVYQGLAGGERWSFFPFPG